MEKIKVFFEGSLGDIIVALTAESVKLSHSLENPNDHCSIKHKNHKSNSKFHPTTVISTRHFRILGIHQDIRIAVFGWKAFCISMQNNLVPFSPTYMHLCTLPEQDNLAAEKIL